MCAVYFNLLSLLLITSNVGVAFGEVDVFNINDAFDHEKNTYVPTQSRWLEVGFVTLYPGSWTSVETTYNNFSDPVVFLSLPNLSTQTSTALRVNNTKLEPLDGNLKRYSFEARIYGVVDQYCNASAYDLFRSELELKPLTVGWLVVERGTFSIAQRKFIINTNSVPRYSSNPDDPANIVVSNAPSNCDNNMQCELDDGSSTAGTIGQLQTTRYEGFLVLRSPSQSKMSVTYVLYSHDSVFPENAIIPSPGEVFAWIIFNTDLAVSCVENLAIETFLQTVTDHEQTMLFANQYSRVPALFGTVNELIGKDSFVLRAMNISNVSTAYIAQEDRCFDTEISHTPESAAFLTIGRAYNGGTVRCGATLEATPTVIPSQVPSAAPSFKPSAIPSREPSGQPTGQPTSGNIIMSSALSPDGFTVTVDFNVPTTRTPALSSFPCTDIIYFSLANFSMCSWTSSKRLTARLYANTAVEYDGSLTAYDIGSVNALYMKIQAACSGEECSYFETSRKVPIDLPLPSKRVVPVVALSTSSNYVLCEGVTLDPKPSAGKAGNKWVLAEWNVRGTGDTMVLENLLNTEYSSSTDELIALPLASVSAAGNFTVSLSVTNFFNITSTASVSIFADDSLLRNAVSIVGSQRPHIHRNEDLKLFTRTSTPKCSGVGVPQLNYIWSVREVTSNGTEDHPELVSTSSDPRLFRLPAYSLNSSITYEIEVSPFVDDDRVVPSPYSITVVVDPVYGIKAKISGGDVRTVSSSNSWTLDASRSFHLDQPDTPLNYTWSCVDITASPTSNAPCDLENILDDSAVLSVDALSLSSDKTFKISVTVSSDLDGGTSTASVTVAVSSQLEVPLLTMGNVADKTNPVTSFLVNCTIVTPFSIKAIWSSPDIDSTTLAAYSPSPLSHAFAAGTHVFSLKMLPGLVVAGKSYSFEIRTELLPSSVGSTVTVADTVSLSKAEVWVEMNVPPYRGSMSVIPSTGVALNTTFQLETYSWISPAENYPLTYRMHYYSTDPDARTTLLVPGVVSNAKAIFGEGDAENEYVVTCIAGAVDVYGSAGEVSRAIHVYPNTDSISYLLSAAVDEIATAGNATNFDALEQLTSGYAKHIVKQDCSAAPDCSALNRQPCSEYPNMCGACLSEYVGLDAPSNNACVTADIDATPVQSGACSIATDCLSFQCIDGACVSEVLKECPGSCSNNGQCVAISTNGESMASCSVFNPFCYVECNCDVGFHGKYCHYDETDFTDIQQWQELLCTEYLRLSEFTDLSADSTLSRATVMSLLLKDLTLLNPSAFDSCASVIIDTIFEDPAVCGDDVPYLYWLGVLSDALAAPQNDAVNPAVLHSILDTVVALGTGAHEHLATGQSYEHSTDHIRIISRLSFPQGAEDTTGEYFNVPHTEQETASGIVFGTIDVGEVSPADASEVGHIVILYLNTPAGIHGNATRLSLESTYYAAGDADSGGRRRKLTDDINLVRNVTVVLPNYRPLVRSEAAIVDEVVVECYFNLVNGVESSYFETVECGAVTHEVPCYGNSTYSVIVDCLSDYAQPQCNVLDASDVFQPENCTLIAYTKWNTTCLCSESYSIKSGVDATANNMVNRDYGVTASLVGESFTSRFGAVYSLSLSSLENNAIVFGIMLGLVVILLVGGALILFTDFLHIEYAAIREKYVDSGFMRARTFKELVSSTLPIQFSGLPWYRRYKALLCEDHEWLALFFADRSDYSQHDNFVFLLWIHAFGKLINFFFVGTVLALLYFADDDTCESYSSRQSCLEPVSINLQDSLCEWRSETVSCHFVEIGSSFDSAIAVAIAINVLVAPVDAMLRFLLLMARRLLIVKEDKLLSTLEGRKKRSSSSYLGGELTCMQTTKSKMMCAARLGHMKDHIDKPVTIFGEVDEFLHLHRGKRAVDENVKMDTEFNRQESVVAQKNANREIAKWNFLVQESMYDAPAHFIQRQIWEDDLMKTGTHHSGHVYWLMYNVRMAKQRASSALATMRGLPDDDRRDEFLLRLFFVEAMSGYRRQVSSLFFLDRNKFGYKSGVCSSSGFQWACTIFIPVYLFFFCFYIFIFGISIGPSATNLWLISICFAYLQNIVLIEPILIFVYGISIAGLIYDDVRSLAHRINVHGKNILTRHRGTTFSPSVFYMHHINAACRSAREVPNLVVSRLLISFNDWDLPVSFMSRYHRTGILASCVRGLLLVQALCALVFLYVLPTAVQEAVIETVLSLIVGFIFVIFYVSSDSGAESLGIAFGVLVLLFLVAFIFSYVCLLRKRRVEKGYRFDHQAHDASLGTLRKGEFALETSDSFGTGTSSRALSRVTFTDGDVSSVHIISDYIDSSPGSERDTRACASPEEAQDELQVSPLFEFEQGRVPISKDMNGEDMCTATREMSLRMLVDADGDISFEEEQESENTIGGIIFNTDSVDDQEKEVPV